MSAEPTSSSPAEKFLIDAEVKAFDLKHRKTIKHNMGKYDSAVKKGLNQYNAHASAKDEAAFQKSKALFHLDHYLEEFEAKISKRGAQVLWASDAKEALVQIGHIMQEVNAKLVVKSKSMTTEELHLNDYLTKHHIAPVETDLGEYIVQLAGQRPYHIVTPCMHMSKEDIADIFVKHLDIKRTTNPEELVAIARQVLREKYTSADVGITGANFVIADTGSIAITENEGNARLSMTFPKVHIVIAGIEKVIPKLEDLDLFWPLLATHGTGQQMTVYNTIVSGPRQGWESDGPEKMYVILLDNGRTNLLADVEKREALRCIRCGACLNACPVYRNIGGHTYESTYTGPIGSVITPHLQGMDEYKHLSYASSLCGACTSVCPVRIDLANLLLLNRKESVEKGLVTSGERWAIRIWSLAMRRKGLLNLVSPRLKNIAFHYLFHETWSKRRNDIKMAPKSFTQLWKESLKDQD